MVTLPEPLHPALVHFPIVLLLLGAAAAVISALVNRGHLAWLAAALLGLGALGSFLAVRSGDAAEDSAGKLAPAVEALVKAHEAWAERTQVAGEVAASLALAAALLGAAAARGRRPRGSAGTGPMRSMAGWTPRTTLALSAGTFRALTAAVALTACVFVYETARRGGELVYAYGVGVKAAPGQVLRNPPAERD
jgi:uncharacterized membrane protein